MTQARKHGALSRQMIDKLLPMPGLLVCEGCGDQETKDYKDARKVHEDALLLNTYLWPDGWNGGQPDDCDMCPECSSGFLTFFVDGWKDEYK